MTADTPHALHFDPSCEECAYLARPTRETLAATEPGLDVERLARAMKVILGGSDFNPYRIEDARNIAAEYARLSGREP